MINFTKKPKPRGYDQGNERSDRQMHSTTCSDCGKSCEVPFKPSGSKPVYCSNCFQRDESPRRDDRGGRGERGDKKSKTILHKATCSACGEGCELPFKPSGNKPVYCRDCFNKDEYEETIRTKKPDNSGKKHDEINAKLDHILAILKTMNAPKEPVEKKPVAKKAKKEKAILEEVVKKAAKKVAAKKVAPKKAPKKAAAKKVTPKKPAKKVVKKAAPKKATKKKTK
jgi:CxxC-x17-CxxC domain-containing protein